MDPHLDSITNLLMEEGTEEDAACCAQPDGDAAYGAIFCSLLDIISESKSCVDSTSLHSSHASLQFPFQICDTQPRSMRYNGLNILTHHRMLNSGPSTLPPHGTLQSSFLQPDTSLVMPASPNLAIHQKSSTSTSNVQDYQGAIEFNDVRSFEKLMDVQVSCWKEDKLGPNRSFRSCISGRGSLKEQYDPYFRLASPYKEFSLELTRVKLSFEDLKIHDHYTDLYVGKPHIPEGAPKYGNKENVLTVADKGSKRRRKRTEYVQEYVDMKELLVNCAQAVAVGNARAASELLQDVRQRHGADAGGSSLQRVVHYFCEALVARMKGTGDQQLRAILHQKPSSTTIRKSHELWYKLNPFLKIVHYFANQSILMAAEQASRLHIVDYGLESGVQYAYLINALADREGGPPLLVITGVDYPQPGTNPAERLEDRGWRLAAFARACNVPFQYYAITSSKWEDLDSSSFHFHEDEILVVNCIRSLRHLADEGVDLVSPRQKVLTCIRKLNPHLLITADLNASYGCSSFVSRFQEALYFYCNVFDMVDTLLWGDSPERLLKESVFLYSEILNIVACEGAERVERVETYKQWQARVKRAGFEQLLIPPGVLSRSRSHAKMHNHKDFFVHDDANKWMLLGWRGRIFLAISAWKPSHARLAWEKG